MSTVDGDYPQYRIADFPLGTRRSQAFSITHADLTRFVEATGDDHPLHTSPEAASARGYAGVIVHGMLIASRCSAFITRAFVGTSGLLVRLTSDFRNPVQCDEPLVWNAEVTAVSAEAGTVELGWNVMTPVGRVVQRGTACAWLSTRE